MMDLHNEYQTHGKVYNKAKEADAYKYQINHSALSR